MVPELALKQQARSYLAQLLRGLRRGDLINVLKASKGDGVYVLSDKTTYSALGTIPWPVVWLLGGHSEKFRHSGTIRGSAKQLFRAVHIWANKVRWRLHFEMAESHDEKYGVPNVHMHGNHECVNGSYWGFLRSKHNRVPPTPDYASEKLEELIGSTVRTVELAYERSHSFRSTGDLVGLTRLAYTLVRQLDYNFIPTEQDGGFCAVHVEDLAELQNGVLRSDDYETVQRCSATSEELTDEYIQIYKDVADAEG